MKGGETMADQKKLVEAITSMDEDFAKWYTDVVKKAELVDYSGVKGCMVIRPYGYAIWENIQQDLDRRFKETGHENVYMPLFIPESLLQKEKDHVAGFAPEVAWVTQGGDEKLAERLCVRPTSEVLFCEHYAKIINSYRDLPKLYNQWCSVVRWEKTTRPFLRSSEFLWQEGHTMHETAEEAREETLRMLKVYTDFYRETLAIPAVTGRKTEKEKFAGALETYTIEPMMHNGVALQGGTSHYFGDGFAKSFGIAFTGRDNTLQHPHQTSWGVSTRMIGAIIMVHGDDNGLVLPPKVAPVQVVIVPIAQHKPGVLEAAATVRDRLKAAGVRVKLDDSDQSPGWKFSQYEMQGVPLRLELGPKDLEKGQCVLVRRDSREKSFTPLEGLEQAVNNALAAVHEGLYQRALANLHEKTFVAHTHEEFLEIAQNHPGFIKAMWCGDTACEEKLKEETGGVKSRCIPFEEEHLGDTCVCCGRPARHQVYWGRQY
jgi:prolyl-tRNA synthetase